MNEETLPRGEQTRAAILQSAHDLFVAQGYHGTSMRQVAHHAGIALGGLYNHFPSKEAVFKAVFLAYHPYQQVLPLIQAAGGEDIEVVVRNAADIMVKVINNRPDFMNLMFIELVEFKSIHAQKLVASLLPVGVNILEGLLSTSPGRLRPIPQPMVVRSFLGLFFAYYLTEVLFSGFAPPEFREHAMQHFVDIYLNGILARHQVTATSPA